MRGEYSVADVRFLKASELPPRARRILASASTFLLEIGTTSACAENTQCPKHQCLSQWNYLRVRGEYYQQTFPIDPSTELPPRARRILFSAASSRFVLGTTSACAENTQAVTNPAQNIRNYLRVRGEYFYSGFGCGYDTELPPRARRIRQG